jgi:hypothetical protein
LLDSFNEHISCDCHPIVDEIRHGALYDLRVTNISRDWETGIVDDYDFEFVKRKEKAPEGA